MSDSIKCRCCNRDLTENDRVVAYVCPACKWCNEYGDDDSAHLRAQLATLRAAAWELRHVMYLACNDFDEAIKKYDTAIDQLSSGGVESRNAATSIEQAGLSKDAHGANQCEKSTPDSSTMRPSGSCAPPAGTHFADCVRCDNGRRLAVGWKLGLIHAAQIAQGTHVAVSRELVEETIADLRWIHARAVKIIYGEIRNPIERRITALEAILKEGEG